MNGETNGHVQGIKIKNWIPTTKKRFISNHIKKNIYIVISSQKLGHFFNCSILEDVLNPVN